MGMVTRRHFVTINFFLGRGQPERQGQGHEGTCPLPPLWRRPCLATNGIDWFGCNVELHVLTGGI